MNQLAHRPARAAALAREQQQIDRNVAAIREQQQAPNRATAIQAMATRLNLTPAKLQETLRNTVFRDANDHEFAALIIVANEYKLNPLTKEIYAFKAKGGGIIPYVSIDGWIRIINEHPQFDGIEFNDIVDEKGELEAIECVIYRKDRSRPIKVVEYLDECVRDTDPWRKSPKRFLRHRSIMQCGRVAFGFSGIGSEDDYEIVGYVQQDGGENARPYSPPPRMDQIEYDSETGEITEEAARAADAEGFAEMEGRTPEDQRGEGTTLESAKSEIDAAELVADVNSRVTALIPLLGDEDAETLRQHAMDRIATLSAK